MQLSRLTLALSSLSLLPLACGTDQRPLGYDPQESETTADESIEVTPFSVPGMIEAEHFFRASGAESTREELETCGAPETSLVKVEARENLSNGCALVSGADTTWVEYDIDVEATGNYHIGVGIKRGTDAQDLQLLIDGTLRDTIEAGSVFSLGEEVFFDVPLAEGKHVLRLAFDGAGNLVDNLAVTQAGSCQPACQERECGDDFCGANCGICDDSDNCSDAGQCSSGPSEPVDKHGALSVSGNQIVSEDGTPVQLRGVSTQWLNWEQEYSTSKEGLQFMRDEWGLEIVRIANGVEAQGGYATESVRPGRLSMVRDIIENAVDLGLYVLVDWHTHEEEHLELSKEFFTKIAEEYGELPNIIYEPFNEPIGEFGDAQERAYWDETLKPYHEEIVAHIRKLDPDNLIILGTPLWSQGVHHAAANPVQGENLAYTVHFYSCSHTDWLIERVRRAQTDGIALFATEWGSTDADGGTVDNPEPCIAQARDWHRALDEMNIGSTAWKLTSDGDASALLVGNPPVSGGWTTEDLSEHGKLVRELLQGPRSSD